MFCSGGQGYLVLFLLCRNCSSHYKKIGATGPRARILSKAGAVPVKKSMDPCYAGQSAAKDCVAGSVDKNVDMARKRWEMLQQQVQQYQMPQPVGDATAPAAVAPAAVAPATAAPDATAAPAATEAGAVVWTKEEEPPPPATGVPPGVLALAKRSTKPQPYTNRVPGFD